MLHFFQAAHLEVEGCLFIDISYFSTRMKSNCLHPIDQSSLTKLYWYPYLISDPSTLHSGNHLQVRKTARLEILPHKRRMHLPMNICLLWYTNHRIKDPYRPHCKDWNKKHHRNVRHFSVQRNLLPPGYLVRFQPNSRFGLKTSIKRYDLVKPDCCDSAFGHFCCIRCLDARSRVSKYCG